jgi:hypothetical protein
MVRKDPKFIPDELVPKHVFEGMQLRNRLTPRSITSIPAILSSESSYISDVFKIRGDGFSDSDDDNDDNDGDSSNRAPLILASSPLHRSVSETASPKKTPKQPQQTPGRMDSGSVNIDDISPVLGSVKASHSMYTTKHDVTAQVHSSPGIGQSPNLNRDAVDSSQDSPDSFRSAISHNDSRGSNRSVRRGDGSLSESRRAFLEGIMAMDADELNKSIEKKKKPSPNKTFRNWVKKVVSPIRDRISGIASSFRQDESVVEEIHRSPPVQSPVSIIYEAPAKKKRQKVQFDITPELRSQRTRAGRVTKIPARYRD